MLGYTCTYPVTRAGVRGKCGAPGRWIGKVCRCDRHRPRGA